MKQPTQWRNTVKAQSELLRARMWQRVEQTVQETVDLAVVTTQPA